jgi:hypothetical protein
MAKMEYFEHRDWQQSSINNNVRNKLQHKKLRSFAVQMSY